MHPMVSVVKERSKIYIEAIGAMQQLQSATQNFHSANRLGITMTANHIQHHQLCSKEVSEQS